MSLPTARSSDPGPNAGGKPIPPPPKESIWRLVAEGLQDPLAYLMRMHRDYGDVVTLRKNRTFMIGHPDGIKHILQDNHPNYEKGEKYRSALGPLMGKGLLTAEGEEWKVQRRLAQPAFLHKQHAHFAEAVMRHMDALVAQVRQHAREGSAFDLHHTLAHHFLTVIMELLFSQDVEGHSEELSHAFLAAEQTMNIAAVFLPVRLPRWVPTPGHVRFQRAVKTLDGFLDRVVAKRRAEGAARNDLLAGYLSVRDEETGRGLSDPLLRDEMITLLSAGHETTSDSITWTFFELMRHPDVYDRVCGEADAAGNLASPLAIASAVPYITMVYQEALRLYPPGWGLIRTALQDDEVLNYRIPAGGRVVVSPYVMHHDERFWPEPERFDPDRFEDARVQQRHRFAWFPFSAGPRKCIGMGLAMLEVQLTIATLSREVRFELLPGQAIRPLPRVSLKPDRPVMVRAHFRA